MHSDWFVPLNDAGNVAAALLCFPFAGGNSMFFSNWRDYIPPRFALYAVDLPGRGRRFGEPLLENLPEVLEALIGERRFLPEAPCLFFGHSLGALLAYEFAAALESIRDVRRPVYVVVSGRGAPHVVSSSDPIHHLPDAEFKEKLRHFQGTPAEVLENQQLMDLFLPVLRADFRISETSEALSSKVPLSVPLIASGGTRDAVDFESLKEWRHYTRSRFDCWRFSGGHFYLREHGGTLAHSLIGLLQAHIKSR